MSQDQPQQPQEAPAEYADVWHQLDPGTKLLLSDPEGLIPAEQPPYNPDPPESLGLIGSVEKDAYKYAYTAARGLVEKDVLKKENLITTQERDQAQLAAKEARYEATHDKMTGFYNRAGFDIALQRMIDTNPDADIGILYIDIDNFKSINDSEGHDGGDAFLKETVAWLREVNDHPEQTMDSQIDPAEQDMIMARVGGDELVIAINYSRVNRPIDESVEKQLLTDRDRLYKGFNQFMEKQHYYLLTEFNVGVSIGVAHWRLGIDPDKLVIRGDKDMYRQKAINRRGGDRRR